MKNDLKDIYGQYIIYAKYHYKQSENRIQDLMTLNENYCALPKGWLCVNNIYQNCHRAFTRVADENMMEQFFKDLYGYQFLENVDKVSKKDVIDRMLSLLSILKVRDGDTIIWDLPEANPELLELSETYIDFKRKQNEKV